ncbi:MAG: hypothetical protein ACK4NC_07155, partial [Candidatus Gracilibacteria bacterium]
MAYIANWLNQQLQAKQADLIVNDTIIETQKRSNLLAPYVPFKAYDGRKFLSYVVKEVNTVASVVAYGAELPVAAQGNFQKITAQMLKTGLTYRFDEETQWDMKEAMEYAQAKGVYVQDIMTPDGKITQGTANDLAGFLFGTIQRMVKAQLDLLDALTWQVLQTGQLDWKDFRTGTKLTINYLNGNDDYPNTTRRFQTVSDASNRSWDNYQNANGIQDLYNAVDDFIEVNGFAPSLIVMSRRLRNHLMQQQTTKDAASSLTVTQVGTVSPEMLKAILEARGIPPIVTFDERYQIDGDGSRASTIRFLNDNRFVFLTRDMGQRAMGTTIESD